MKNYNGALPINTKNSPISTGTGRPLSVLKFLTELAFAAFASPAQAVTIYEYSVRHNFTPADSGYLGAAQEIFDKPRCAA